MRLHIASAGYGTYRTLRHCSDTPAPYACHGLPASCFALPWRAAMVAMSALQQRTGAQARALAGMPAQGAHEPARPKLPLKRRGTPLLGAEAL